MSTTNNYIEAYSRLEGDDDEPIYGVFIKFHLDEYDECIYINMENLNDDQRFAYRYAFNHHAELIKRMGVALGRSTILSLTMIGEVDDEIDVSNAGVECLRDFYDGLKHNSSIQQLKLHLDILPHNRIPTFEVGSANFAESLIEFTILSQDNMNDYQSFRISNWLQDMPSLQGFHIDDCKFGLNESPFRRVILASSQVRLLSLNCKFNYQYAALATLLRDAGSSLNMLGVGLNENSARGLASIAHSLKDNKCMKVLRITNPVNASLDMNPLEKLLCDVSGIQRIHSSNHFLEEVSSTTEDENDQVGNPFIEACLRLNRMENKERVIRKKIARFYFNGSFDVSLFLEMPISALPSVMELIEGEVEYRLNAIFRVLRCIPELCNHIGRRDLTGTKRQKCLK